MEILNEGKLSVIRRYFFESVLVALSLCVATLFYMYVDLTNYIRVTLTHEVQATRLIIQENSRNMQEMKFIIEKNGK